MGLCRWKGIGAVVLCAGLVASMCSAHAQSSNGGTPARTWSVAPAAGVERKDISFNSSGARFSGTLFYPRGARRCATVIVFHGAQVPLRTLPLYRHLEQMLPPLGVAVFVFDRRGSGASEAGDKDPYDFNVLAGDGVAARAALEEDPHVDAKRIGYWGLSQGGWLALLAATRDPKAAFVISVSAPMTTPDVQMNFAVANILRIKGYSEKDVNEAVGARRAVDDYLRGKLDRASAQRALDGVRGKPWFGSIYMSDTLGEPATSSWLKQMRVDPLNVLDKVKAPTLMVYGGADPWVPVEISRERLAAGHANVKTVVIEGADHTMTLGVDPKEQIDPALLNKEAPNAPAYFALLGAWLTQHGFARAN